ncbi:MAG: hypothetical protein QF578_11475 [Alphaproteobacteria bacterium]|jgi:hypothetical protein|nr:hypothetical protein [Alphaproteobacteria bacterium]MDP6565437.1 hypothetical protein [Alphaproteobacteria bacterium]MDP6814466.1 hypothetical protein [Alphaproteobacteria bacterium]
MAFRYDIDPSIDLQVVQAEGVVTDDDVYDYIRTAAADPRAAGVTRVLCDLRRIDKLEVSATTIRALADPARSVPNRRRAFVVGDDVTYGMLRMYQIMTDSDEAALGLFRDEAEARAWLDLAADYRPPFDWDEAGTP